MKKLIYSIVAIGFLLLIFTNPILASDGAKMGLLLWFNTILPTLLPFIILSNIIISLDATKYISFFLKPILSRLFSLSNPAIYAFVIGLLSGYPLGAKASGDLVVNKNITQKEGQYLLSFCNNASPMFIIGYIATASMKLPNLKYVFLVIIYLSSILTAIILKNRFLNSKKLDSSISKNNLVEATCVQTEPTKITFSLIDKSIMNGFETITKIGGYIILFSILSSLISSIDFDNPLIKCIILGTVEITTGISYITNSMLPLKDQVVLITTLTAFGGLSSIAQTESVINQSGLSSVVYILCKLLNAFIALCLSLLYVNFLM